MKQNNIAISFKGKLIKSGAWTILTLPKNANAKLPLGNIIMVEGAINSLPFRAALESDDKGSHQLKMNNEMCKAMDVKAGDNVMVEITRIGEEKDTRIPLDLSKALAKIPKAEKSWEDITPMARRDWVFSVSTAKQLETRERRIEKAVDMLSSGKKRLCCFPGIKWLMKKNAKSCGMWLPLSD